MQRIISVISSVGCANYTCTILFIQTIASCGHQAVAIMPGTTADILLNNLVKHDFISSPSRNFWYDASFFNTTLAIAQRISRSLILFKKLVRLKPYLCICSEPDSWLVAIVVKWLIGCRVVVDLRVVYEDRVLSFPKLVHRLARGSIRALMKWLTIHTDQVIHVSKERQKVYSYLHKQGVVINSYPEKQYESFLEACNKVAMHVSC